jgi:dTDP-4-amino-4,6-dideoxygalactose transaminase
MDPVKLEVLLEQQTVKVVIIQHTLGIVANIDALRTLCDRYNCQLLEDCAHSL